MVSEYHKPSSSDKLRMISQARTDELARDQARAAAQKSLEEATAAVNALNEKPGRTADKLPPCTANEANDLGMVRLLPSEYKKNTPIPPLFNQGDKVLITRPQNESSVFPFISNIVKRQEEKWDGQIVTIELSYPLRTRLDFSSDNNDVYFAYVYLVDEDREVRFLEKWASLVISREAVSDLSLKYIKTHNDLDRKFVKMREQELNYLRGIMKRWQQAELVAAENSHQNAPVLAPKKTTTPKSTAFEKREQYHRFQLWDKAIRKQFSERMSSTSLRLFDDKLEVEAVFTSGERLLELLLEIIDQEIIPHAQAYQLKDALRSLLQYALNYTERDWTAGTLNQAVKRPSYEITPRNTPLPPPLPSSTSTSPKIDVLDEIMAEDDSDGEDDEDEESDADGSDKDEQIPPDRILLAYNIYATAKVECKSGAEYIRLVQQAEKAIVKYGLKISDVEYDSELENIGKEGWAHYTLTMEAKFTVARTSDPNNWDTENRKKLNTLMAKIKEWGFEADKPELAFNSEALVKEEAQDEESKSEVKEIAVIATPGMQAEIAEVLDQGVIPAAKIVSITPAVESTEADCDWVPPAVNVEASAYQGFES